MNRRSFLKSSSLTLAAAPLLKPLSVFADHVPAPAVVVPAPTQSSPGPFELPKLPYAEHALAPFISAQTMALHHGKHQGGYVTKLNELVKSTAFEKQSLENIFQSPQASPAMVNMAAQIWNHSFFWTSLRPENTQGPQGKLKKAIETQWKSVQAFQDEFSAQSTSLFGSGWTWLVTDATKKLSIVQTKDAGNPLSQKLTPLLTLDVWEHAYYLDYQSRRKDYVSAIVSNLLNWDFAQENFVRVSSTKG